MMLRMSNYLKTVLSAFVLIMLVFGLAAGGTVLWDLSENDKVDLEDLKILADHWLDVECSAPACSADLDGVPGVDMADFAKLAANWGWRIIDRNDYADRLRALWLGECIANWTGIQTEGDRSAPPFYTDDDWSGFGFVLDQDPWKADDDTDIEYVYCHLMNKHQTHMLSPEQIRDGWINHINRRIWVSNAHARGLMDKGYVPPQTSMLALNHLALMIDAQLTTEIFGALAPGLPGMALKMGDLPIRTTATGYAAHASQYFLLLYCLAGQVDRQIPIKEQVIWLADEARRYIPDTSKSADIYDFVKADYLANPDKDDWESTRYKIYVRYRRDASTYGFRYQKWVESSVNFAAGIMALFYGEGDYRKTVKIGTLAGWDSDNSTATLGGLLGFMYGYDELVTEFPQKTSFSDRYWINRTRDNMPDYLPADAQAEDTFTMLADRMLGIIDIAVQDAGGVVDLENNKWYLPPVSSISPRNLNPLNCLMERSANNRLRRLGGTVTAESSVSVDSDVNLIADGFEHNFAGEEWWPTDNTWFYSTYQGNGRIQTLSVNYDRPVHISVVRYIEGGSDFAGGWFTSVEVEVKIDGMWQVPPGMVTSSQPLDPGQDYQIIDYVLSQPVQATGIRITGPAGGLDGYVTVLELDALGGGDL